MLKLFTLYNFYEFVMLEHLLYNCFNLNSNLIKFFMDLKIKLMFDYFLGLRRGFFS